MSFTSHIMLNSRTFKRKTRNAIRSIMETKVFYLTYVTRTYSLYFDIPVKASVRCQIGKILKNVKVV